MVQTKDRSILGNFLRVSVTIARAKDPVAVCTGTGLDSSLLMEGCLEVPYGGGKEIQWFMSSLVPKKVVQGVQTSICC